MTTPSDSWKPGDQFEHGGAIVGSVVSGIPGGPRKAHELFGDFDIGMIPDWAFWPYKGYTLIKKIAKGDWTKLISSLADKGSKLLGKTVVENHKRGQSTGDPHNVSFRGMGFDFQAAGEFTYVRAGSGAEEFRVDVRHIPLGDHAAVIGAVAVKLGPLVIEVSRHRLNPTIAGLPVAVGVGGVTGFTTTDNKFLGMLISQLECFQIIDLHMNVVQIERTGDHLDLYVMLNIDLNAEASGILGNPLRGLLHIDGTPLPERISVEEMRRFASEWAVAADKTSFTDGEFAAYDPKFPARFLTVADLDPQTRARAESLARGRLGTAPDAFVLDSCIYDVGFAGDAYLNSYGFHELPPTTARLAIAR